MTENTFVDGEFEIWRNKQWRITNLFLEQIADPALAGPPYWISLARLSEPSWPEHMCEKTWVDPEQFIEAYRKACETASIQPNEAGIDAVRSARAAAPSRPEKSNAL
jgi:hypothetical protein